MSPKNEHSEHPMSAAAATELVRKMIHSESQGPGDAENAMRRIAERYGIGFWTQDHLRKKRAKTIDGSLLSRIRNAYIDMLERQLSHLASELAVEKAFEKAMGDDTLADIELEISALAQKVAQKRAAR